ncbi:UNVERIFIED_CONTAM: hypothetical protein Sangu_0392100 [Sesamum angustifolium]|uniref:Uncharacterized protein n=1 Tax=Sesamum angustifolium TaxID=2727405 RepID=A0AAW2QSG9_9LAMI
MNAILWLQDDSGNWVDEPAALQRLMEHQFSKIFKFGKPSVPEMEREIEHLMSKLDQTVEEDLALPFAEAEIVHALFQVVPLKSPRLDGLRHGDPLSPYRFLLYTEPLSSLIAGTERQARRQFTILRIVGNLRSGQVVNFSKSPVVFSRNVELPMQEHLLGILGIRRAKKHDMYLGLPTIVGKSHSVVFHSLRNRVWQHISKWNEKMMSQARKGVLIKAVLQSIPAYAMGVFRIPSEESSLARLVQMCVRSGDGGLGFRELRVFNRAMLAKQYWQIFKNPDSLLNQLLKAHYFPHISFLEAPSAVRPSLTWWSLMSARPLMEAGLRWRVGAGDHIIVLKSPWILRPTSFRPITPISVYDPNLLVSSLINHAAGEWRRERLLEVFHPMEIEVILTIPLGRVNQQDVAIWHYTLDGRFSVCCAYHLDRTLNVRPLRLKGLYLGNSFTGQKFDLRNGVLMEGKHQQPTEVLEGVTRYLVEFQTILRNTVGGGKLRWLGDGNP